MYYPTIRSLKREYGLLNKRVFNGCLPDSSEIEFEIGNMSDALGICKYIITRDTLAIKVLPEFKDRELFVAILAHEMVHLYEHVTYNQMTHGPKFYEWKETLAEHGIDLSRSYDAD